MKLVEIKSISKNSFIKKKSIDFSYVIFVIYICIYICIYKNNQVDTVDDIQTRISFSFEMH